MINKFVEGIMKLVFPPKCIFCGKLLDLNCNLDICDGCFDTLPFIYRRIEALEQQARVTNYCDGVIAVFKYSGMVKEAIKRYKFSNKASYYKTFSSLLAEGIKKMTNYRRFDIIMSVPLYKYKQTLRGFNQSLLISRTLSKELGIPDYSNWITRTKNTGTQSLLSKNKRFSNVNNAFKVTDILGVKGKSILIIDDILTTGYTINECCRALKEAGASVVAAGVIATGRRL